MTKQMANKLPKMAKRLPSITSTLQTKWKHKKNLSSFQPKSSSFWSAEGYRASPRDSRLRYFPSGRFWSAKLDLQNQQQQRLSKFLLIRSYKCIFWKLSLWSTKVLEKISSKQKIQKYICVMVCTFYTGYERMLFAACGEESNVGL